MKHLFYTLAIASGSLLALNANAKVGDLLPRPHQIELTAGAAPFALQRTVAITDPTGCTYLKNFFTANGCTIAATGESAAATVTVTLASAIDGAYDYEVADFPNEGYKLSITANTINITAASPTAVIRAAQTLQQLAEGYTDTGAPAALEALSMTDWPAFKVRGWMQDVGRSFLSVDELKKEIDLYARFKVNVFHWHLTEKIGWRFEVKAYPQLTSYTNGVRYPGQYYTQEQCKEVEAYAAERGITVIPEIDMPGHSDVFKNAMGFDMQTDEGKKALKVILKEAAEVFPRAPYIHIGGDEVTIKDGFLEEMTDFVRNTLGRKVVLWNKLNNKAVTKDIADMTQMWATSGTAVKGLPNIDCRYNYINHFDVYADLVGIYKSNIYYADKGNPDIAGTISAAWNDTKVATEDDIIRQNNQYANVLASAERGWIGGGKQYIEAGGTRLPNTGEEYEEFADFERRFLFHKAHSLQGAPIPYVKQSNIRWRLTEPFPNDGDATKAFPPEEAAKLDAVMPTTYSYNGTDYAAKQVTGGGVYLRHIWHGTVRGVLNNPANNQTCYAWTYVYSPVAQDAGAQIEFYTYSRSGSDKMPPAGKWDRRGSQVWLNGQEIAAPTWQQPDKDIPQDNTTLGLTNENFTARPVVKVHLNEGWNKVFLKLPHANSGGTARDKWQYTFVLTDTEGKNALEGITYSPDRTLAPFAED
uniref:family 20 glycosylhydrolase n=1 Tax=Prevotellamassilia timonensis TaxID=1852370 RepID=UPI004025FF32